MRSLHQDVARIHVSRTSNLYPDTCRWIQVTCPGYLWTVSRRHSYYSFMSRSTCIPLYPATDGRQTSNIFFSPMQDTCRRRQLDTTCIRQHVSWCKRGIGHLSLITSLYQLACTVLWFTIPETSKLSDQSNPSKCNSYDCLADILMLFRILMCTACSDCMALN